MRSHRPMGSGRPSLVSSAPGGAAELQSGAKSTRKVHSDGHSIREHGESSYGCCIDLKIKPRGDSTK